jgi:hypothetical protein
VKRWQIISRRNRTLFDVLQDPDGGEWLSTIEMPKSLLNYNLGYRYESCLFVKGSSDVIARYETLSEALEGHENYRKIYGFV